MLSAKAARSIHSRVVAVSHNKPAWQLHTNKLRACGLSGRKIKAIKAFGRHYEAAPESIEKWASMPYSALEAEVSSFWGMSSWTASILALGHLGHRDVFPSADGSIQRACSLVERSFGHSLAPENGSPYRSYLALYLWRALDTGLLSVAR